MFRTIMFCGLLLLQLLLTSVVQGSDQSAVCRNWTTVAGQMTGSGRTQVCRINKEECEGLDCKGTVRFMHSRLLPKLALDYCFGCQLNACSKTVTMDFYLTLPSYNVSFVHNVQQNNNFDVPGIQYKTPLGTAGLELAFEFERLSGTSVKFMVKSKVGIKPRWGSSKIFVNSLERTLFDDTVSFATCPSPSSPSSTKTPASPATFAQRSSITACTKEVYTTPKPVVVVNAKYTPSATLHKSCRDDLTLCSQHETCDMATSTCKCLGGYEMTDKKDACLTISRVGKACNSESDCGYAEECKPNQSGVTVCKCQQDLTYDPQREMCLFLSPDSDVITTVPPTKLPKPTEAPVGNSKTGSAGHSNQLHLIIGVAAGGFVVLVAVIVSALAIKRRRRRNANPRLESCAADEPLLSSNYDDSDLVM